MSKQIIIYRGPLERSRLNLLISSITQLGETKFVWIYPGVLSQQQSERFQIFISQYKLADIEILNDKAFKAFSVKAKLKKQYHQTEFSFVHFIGFISYFYAKAFKAKKRVWYVNGIPEEILLHGNTFLNRLKCYLQWKSVKSALTPDMIVPVSKPMGQLLEDRLFKTNFFVVPITVDTSIFKNNNVPKKYYTYLGTGAPWQAIDLLECLWFKIHQLNPEIQFRVISRDPRCRQLGKRIASDKIEFVASSDFNQVSVFLAEAKIGFLIRRNHIVNNVSFPTKYAEYVASGAFVALSEIEWELNSYVEKFKTGLLVNMQQSIEDQAASVLSFAEKHNNNDYSNNFLQSTEALANKKWKQELFNALISL